MSLSNTPNTSNYLPNYNDDYSDDIYRTDVYLVDDLEKTPSEEFSPEEKENMRNAFSAPATPPVKIPSLNSDNVSQRRKSMSERRNSFSGASVDEYSFSPFHYGSDMMDIGFSVDDGITASLGSSPDVQDVVGIENTDKRWMDKLHFFQSSAESGGKGSPRRRYNQILNKFNRTASKIAKLIISEAHMTAEDKTIRPINIGGVGGEKYIYAGIFFKFAIDKQGIYGGDMFAAKAAACELNAIQCIKIANVKSLWAPYMTLIDYRGFRLIATTLLPISQETLKYGSDDGGHTVHKDNQTLNSLIECLGQKLNLKKHQVGLDKQEIYGPADIEGHLGTDGRYYVLDTARLFPTVPPTESLLAFKISSTMTLEDKIVPTRVPFKDWQQTISQMVDDYIVEESLVKKEFCSGVLFHGHRSDFFSPERNKLASSLLSQDIYGDAVLVYTGGLVGQKFHMLFRSEFVLKNEVPLSSDAFTSFEVGEMKEANEADVVDAYERLINEVIPETAQILDRTRKLTGPLLCEILHQNGVNLRLLGTVRQHVKSPKISKLILKEMISRSVKTDIRGDMRRVDFVDESLCFGPVVSFLNLLFGTGSKSNDYWQFFIKTLIMFKFGENGLTEEEKSYQHDLRTTYYDTCQMFIELKDVMSVKFDEFSESMFCSSDDGFQYEQPFHELDIVKLTSKTKCSYSPLYKK